MCSNEEESSGNQNCSSVVKTQLSKLEDVVAKGTDWRLQCATVTCAAFLTHSLINHGQQEVHLQIAIMTVLILFGAMQPQLITAAGCGAFVGGQRIVPTYAWLLLFSLLVGLLWCFVFTRYDVLNGFGGRLGTTTFVGMNLAMVSFLGPTGAVSWDRYGRPAQNDVLWRDEIRDVESALVFVISVVWLAVVGAAARISAKTTPVNPVLVPASWALLSMLIMNATDYRHAGTMYNGFAVGSYVAMASFDRLPKLLDFFFSGLIASGWGLFLAPFFLGFGGKAGFTSVLGHLTYHFTRAALSFMLQDQRQTESEAGKETMHLPNGASFDTDESDKV